MRPIALILALAAPASSSTLASAYARAAERAALAAPHLRALAVPPRAPHEPILRVVGRRSGSDAPINLYVITLGDTTQRDREWSERTGSYPGIFAPFAMNAAQYTLNPDGTWRMWMFRTPKKEENEAWKRYLDRPGVRDFLKRFAGEPNFTEDFGAPDEYIHTRGHVPARELPERLDRASAETLASFLSLFCYNEDGTVRLELRDPEWEEGNAQKVFERLKSEIERR